MGDYNGKAILADDLTGAMDAGVQLAKRGFSVSVMLKPDTLPQDDHFIIADSESRNIPASIAKAQIATWVDCFQEWRRQLVYKKVDSTLRGNLGAEIEALSKPVVLAPAIPRLGRTTREGRHYIDGVPLEESEYAKDPFSPVPHSEIHEILARQSNAACELISLREVRRGSSFLAQRILSSMVGSRKVIICDAVSDEDLSIIAKACLKCPVVPCGSAGLLEQLAPFLQRSFQACTEKPHVAKAGGQGTQAKAISRRSGQSTLGRRSGTVLVVAASPAAVTRRQINYARRHLPEEISVDVDVNRLLSGSAVHQQEVHRAAGLLLSGLRWGKTLLLSLLGPDKAEIMRRYSSDPERLIADSRQLLQVVAGLTLRVLESGPVQGLVLTGGDCAVSVCRELGAWGIKIIEEVEPYIPAGLLLGGPFDSLPVVTKAGGFGTDESLVRAVKYLKA